MGSSNQSLQSDSFEEAQGRPFDALFASLKVCSGSMLNTVQASMGR
jgi:hypothetical protein